LKLQDYDFSLPEELIAKEPPETRGSSRLLVLNKELEDKTIKDFRETLNPGDLLVLNDTKVLKARLDARKPTGGFVEVLIERLLDDNCALAQTKSNRSIREGDSVQIENTSLEIKILDKKDSLYKIQFPEDPKEILDIHGKVPLPPYIKRIANKQDEKRYQTVYANETKENSVAAPTAGLHFSKSQLTQIEEKGVEIVYITLDIGLGTFSPIRSENVEEHVMHQEKVSVDKKTADKINKVLESDSRVIAVGTTVLRCLESVYTKFNKIQPYEGETDLFIYPGYKFGIVDSLLTNFHLPKSSLFILVCAFGGTQNLKFAYRHAVEQNYKFFSYGDAMLINKFDG
jgi:S-adenosylmethionine:tRNA ribosyltransferase-isomerase